MWASFESINYREHQFFSISKFWSGAALSFFGSLPLLTNLAAIWGVLSRIPNFRSITRKIRSVESLQPVYFYRFERQIFLISWGQCKGAVEWFFFSGSAGERGCNRLIVWQNPTNIQNFVLESFYFAFKVAPVLFMTKTFQPGCPKWKLSCFAWEICKSKFFKKKILRNPFSIDQNNLPSLYSRVKFWWNYI